MRELLLLFSLYYKHKSRIIFGIFVSIIALLAGIGLLTLSGWFLAESALAGIICLNSFNYILPASIMRGAAMIRTSGRWVERMVTHDVTFRILKYLRLNVFIHVLPLSPGIISRFPQAELLNRMIADIDTLDHLYLRVLVPLISIFTIILVSIISISLLDLRLSLIIGVIVLIVFLLFPLFLYHIGKPIGKSLTTLRSCYRIQLNTWLYGNAELTVYGAIDIYRYKLDDIENKWQIYQKKQVKLSSIFHSLLLSISGLTLTLVIWLISENIEDYSQSYSLIAIFVFSTLAIFETLTPLIGAFQNLGQVVNSAANINHIIHQDPIITFEIKNSLKEDNVELNIVKLNFNYPYTMMKILNDLSLTISAGEHIAILGHTGSGKSTFLQLLTRAWNPTSGKIIFNGKLLNLWSENTLRSMIAVMPQRIHIFSAVLRDNLKLSSSKCNDKQCIKVLKQVGLETLLNGKGLNAWLGEGGRQLSSGEQRRIGFARMILHNAPLWLLDEPTEGLDVITEKKIIDLLKTYGKNRTIIIVTHRTRGLSDLDRIYVMDCGSIIEQGNHSILMSNHGRYYNIITGH